MRIIYPFLLALILPVLAQAQDTIHIEGWWGQYPGSWTTNFSNLGDTVYFAPDSASGPLWQIGNPNKVLFDSGYVSPNALVTGLDTAYPPNVLAQADMHFRVHNNAGIEFAVIHKYDTDSAMDGGWVEISLNGGPWMNVIDAPNSFGNGLYSSTDTLAAAATPGFSGTKVSNWENFNFYLFNVTGDDVLDLRFMFASDSLHSGKEGWMIGNIWIWAMWEGVEDPAPGFEVQAYPNPATDRIRLDVIQAEDVPHTVRITDLMGKKVLEKPYETGMIIDLDFLEAGNYLIWLSGSRGEAGKLLQIR